MEPDGTGRHGAQIGTGPGELAQVGFGLADHQMALDHAAVVVDERGECGHGAGAKTEIRDEMAIHRSS